jgi:hypothetical protein
MAKRPSSIQATTNPEQVNSLLNRFDAIMDVVRQRYADLDSVDQRSMAAMLLQQFIHIEHEECRIDMQKKRVNIQLMNTVHWLIPTVIALIALLKR